MDFGSLGRKNVRIMLSPYVTYFTTNFNNEVLAKHSNKLYRLDSKKSSQEMYLNLFSMLERPTRLKDVYGSLSEFSKKEICDFLLNLHKYGIILKFENTDDDNSDPSPNKLRNKSINIPSINAMTRSSSASCVLLIGDDGILISKLNSYLKKIGVRSTLFSSTIQSKTTATEKEFRERLEDVVSKNNNNYDIVIAVQDYYNIQLFETVNEICLRMKIPWLRISFDDNLGQIGPFVIPGKTSCYNCCQLRLINNSPFYEYVLWNDRESIPKTKLKVPEYFADMLSTMAIDEIVRYLTNYTNPRTIDNLIILDTDQAIFSKHKIIQHPNCASCKQYNIIKREEKQKGVLWLKKPLAVYPNSKHETLKKLRELVDEKTGLIVNSEKFFEEENNLGIQNHFFSSCKIFGPRKDQFSLFDQRKDKGSLDSVIDDNVIDDNVIDDDSKNTLLQPIFCSGSGFSYADAELHALMESVERYSNMTIDKSSFLAASFNDITTEVVNPEDLVLYSEKQYQISAFKYSRFSNESIIPWVYGYDLFNRERVLIPADFVYYPPIRENPLVRETSNGAAAHTNIFDAILNGLYEVIERDAFLIMWLNKLSMPILDISNCDIDPSFKELIKSIASQGMEVKIIDLTNDIEIPVFMAACYNTNDKYPGLIVGLGCHINHKIAIQKALFEMELMLREFLEHPNKKKIAIKRISSPIDHGIFFLNPKMRKYWDFMINGKKNKDFYSVHRNCVIESTYNNTRQSNRLLTKIVKSLHKMDHRVFYVDITPADIRRLGIVAVKVFVTGLQPMYFGKNYERLNLQRLHKIPITLGYYKNRNPDALQELNLAPHPLA